MTSDASRWSLVVVCLVLAALVVPEVASDRPAAQSSQPSVTSSAGSRTESFTASTAAERVARGAAKHPSVGVVDHALWGDRTMRQRREMLRKIANMNGRWVRIGLPWALVQPRKPTAGDNGWSSWAFDRVDAVVRTAKRNGLKVSITLLGTPGWANGGLGSKYLPDNPATYARAIAHLSKRYRGKVQSWEIWNEVNGGVHLKGATDREYKQLLCAAYPAVKRNAPGAQVVTAGTGGIAVDWIGKLYRLGGKKCMDVVAVHPYNSGRPPHWAWDGGTPRWITAMHEVRRIMRRHQDAKARVWFTEFGFSTYGTRAQGGVTYRQQARWIIEMIKMTDRRLPYVTRMSVYMSRDERSPSAAKDRYYGLHTYNMKPKRSAIALKRYLGRVGRR